MGRPAQSSQGDTDWSDVGEGYGLASDSDGARLSNSLNHADAATPKPDAQPTKAHAGADEDVVEIFDEGDAVRVNSVAVMRRQLADNTSMEQLNVPGPAGEVHGADDDWTWGTVWSTVKQVCTIVTLPHTLQGLAKEASSCDWLLPVRQHACEWQYSASWSFAGLVEARSEQLYDQWVYFDTAQGSPGQRAGRFRNFAVCQERSGLCERGDSRSNSNFRNGRSCSSCQAWGPRAT
jgi:hypothetical protein